MRDNEEKLYTVADIEALPEGELAELIDGKMYMMGTPTTTHQRIIGFLHLKFGNYINGRKGKCEVFLSPYGVYLNETDNYVIPDLLVVCNKDKVDEKGCHGGPDLVVEIVSPSSKKMDYAIKLFKYRTYGVREYWIVDPEKRRIQVYDLEHDDMEEYTFSDKVSVGIYDGDLEIDFSEML
ncbi:MAG: Uma2 family endonuclease [Dorea sp.]|jgi:Uma2 family endonuclease|nr:Uma2 family endonuclease [Dorea sp.]